MLLDKQKLSKMFLNVAGLWRQNIDQLSDIDSRFGDGDHGVTIGKIAGLIQRDVENWGEKSIREFIEGLGQAIMEVGGGSAGPLYGSLVGGLAAPLAEEGVIDTPLLKRMLAASLEEMCDLTTARVGAKTMMDALIPAVAAAQALPEHAETAAVLQAAAQAAAQGAKDTEKYVSRFGRARSYGEQTLGTPDAGAVSTALFFEGLAAGFAA